MEAMPLPSTCVCCHLVGLHSNPIYSYVLCLVWPGLFLALHPSMSAHFPTVPYLHWTEQSQLVLKQAVDD